MNPHITEDAREADDMGEKPDLGRTPDALTEALSGSDMGSDTRAGSLRGGSAGGSEDSADQDEINQTLASEGMASADPQSPSGPAAARQDCRRATVSAAGSRGGSRGPIR